MVNFLLATKGITGWAFYRDGDCFSNPRATEMEVRVMFERVIAIINLVAAIVELIKSFR